MENRKEVEEKIIHAPNGLVCLFINILLMLLCVPGIISGAMMISRYSSGGGLLIGICIIYLCLIGPFMFAGIRTLKPNEAYVLTLFGKYYGTLFGPGIFLVNPFSTAAAPKGNAMETSVTVTDSASGAKTQTTAIANKKMSLKVMTLDNNKQKINDLLGNPIEIGVVVIWRVANTAQAIFNVEDYREYLSTQADTAIRNIARLYPYDVTNDGDDTNDSEESLRGSSAIVAERLKNELQEKVALAGIEVLEARITHLAYATEIASAMLQRQQATAIIAARRLIVEGAVSMVEMALDQLKKDGVVELDEERKAQMVSNLLVVLCGNKDATPVVNSGSIY